MIWQVLFIALCLLYILVMIGAFMGGLFMIITGFVDGEGKFFGFLGIGLILVSVLMAAYGIYETTRPDPNPPTHGSCQYYHLKEQTTYVMSGKALVPITEEQQVCDSYYPLPAQH